MSARPFYTSFALVSLPVALVLLLLAGGFFTGIQPVSSDSLPTPTTFRPTSEPIYVNTPAPARDQMSAEHELRNEPSVSSSGNQQVGLHQVPLTELNKAFVGIWEQRLVAVISTLDDTVIQSGLSWPKKPGAGAITPDGTRLFLAGWGEGSVYGMDTLTYSRVVTLTLVGNDQRGLAISPDGTRLYVADNYYCKVTVLNLLTNAIVATIPLSSHPEKIALSPDGSLLYVAANTPDANFVIDTSTNTVVRTFQAGGYPSGIAVSQDGTTIYVSNVWAGTISVVSASDFSVLKTLPAQSGAHALTFTPDGRKLYSSNYYGNGLSVIDTVALTTIKTLNLGSSPGSSGITADGGKLYVPLASGNVAVVDTTTDSILKNIYVGGNSSVVVTRFARGIAAYSISGRATNGSNNPISGVSISDGVGHTATTDGNGNYTLSGLAAGTYTITPSKGGYTFTPALRTVTVPPDATGQDFVGVGCNWDTLSPHPLLLVHGWGGPSSDRLVDDDQMGWFKYKIDGSNGDWLGASYQEDCNLFYATGVNGSNALLDNARAIHETIVRLVNVMQSNPNWNRHLDIVAHSYGGINSRAYLELYYPGDWGSYYDVDVRDLGIHVDNVFVLGSPLGGATGRELALPGSIYIGGSALAGGNWGSAWQLLAGQMEQFNQQNSQFDRFGQDRGTCYRLISGNMNEQSLPVAMPEPIKRYFSFFQNLPHDVGVSRRSAQVLAESRYQQTYPHVRREYTPDMHGYFTKWNLDTLRSLVHPGDTTAQLILPNIGAVLDWCTPRLTQVTGVELASDTGANDVPLVLLAANSITNSQVITGGFDVSWGGSSLLMLKWMDGDLNLALYDPTGQVISPTQVPADNVVYSRVDFNLSQMASYAFTNTLGGSWSYTITASGLPYTMPFSLMALPDSMIAIRASVPEWNPFASAVPITAEVTYSTTTLISGAVVSVTLARPDGVEDTLLLLDDGAHGDGLAGDGIYGNSYASTLSGFYAASVSASGVYSGEAYLRSAALPFAVGSAGAQFSGRYRDFPSAPNPLGLSDMLNVEVGITMTTVASYTLSANLVASNGVFIAQAKAAAPVSTGTQTVTLAFGGEAIRASGLNGPYTVTQLNLSRDSGGLALKLEELADAWTTAAYDYRQFGQLPRYFGSEKRSDKAVVTTGDVLTYTMLIRNPGDANLFGVVVTDVIPTGTTYVTGSAWASSGVITDIGGIRWSGVVSANGTITLTLCVTATALTGTTITNTASISDNNLSEPIVVSTTTAVHAPTPVAVADLAASRSGTDIVLTWSHTDVVVDHYEVWRSTDPYFVPGEAGSEKLRDVSPPPLGNEASIIDVGALGQTDVNYFYQVKAVNATGEWAVSNRVGAFSFPLTPGGD